METWADRCEMCELLASTYATGVAQLLQAAMWVDRAMRFSDPNKLSEAIAKVDGLRPDVETAWTNLADHRRSEHAGSN